MPAAVFYFFKPPLLSSLSLFNLLLFLPSPVLAAAVFAFRAENLMEVTSSSSAEVRLARNLSFPFTRHQKKYPPQGRKYSMYSPDAHDNPSLAEREKIS